MLDIYVLYRVNLLKMQAEFFDFMKQIFQERNFNLNRESNP